MGAAKLETVESLAARFDLPQRTIIREVLRCRLPYVSIAGNWRFRETDVEVWLERVGPLPRLHLVTGGRTVRHAAAVGSKAQQGQGQGLG